VYLSVYDNQKLQKGRKDGYVRLWWTLEG